MVCLFFFYFLVRSLGLYAACERLINMIIAYIYMDGKKGKNTHKYQPKITVVVHAYAMHPHIIQFMEWINEI